MKPIIIKVSTGALNSELSHLILRQTPGKHGLWNNHKFIINQSTEKCDWWIVCHGSGLQEHESTQCDPNHIVYISMEPNERLGNISDKFLNQFSHLVLCDRNIKHCQITYANGLTWWVGMNIQHSNGHHKFLPDSSFDYDEFTKMKPFQKRNRISVVVSNKSSLPGHIKRLEFLERLKKYPVWDYIDVYGGGFNPVDDKWDAIAPYKYHLVLENDVVPDYWTEKLADSFLAFAYPIYYGSPNITDYFNSDSLLIIDINNIDSTVKQLETLIVNDPYDHYIEYIIESRNKVLNEFNIFNLMACISKESASQYIKCSLQPNSYFTELPIKRIIRNIIFSNKMLHILYNRVKF